MTAAGHTIAAGPRKRYVRAIGPRLRVLLWGVLGLTALLSANSLYLGGVTFLEWAWGRHYQNYFYQCMFLAHLVLGILLVLPLIVFGIAHLINSFDRPNRRAVRAGYMLFALSLTVLISGAALMRLDLGKFALNLRDPASRAAIYWVHVLAPLSVAWLYVLHRLAGPRIKWKVGVRWGAVGGICALAMVWLNLADPRQWNVAGPREGEKYFFPSLARTASGNFIPAQALMMDQYCLNCHKDNYRSWFHSSHHFSSFNNKPYLFSVRETRRIALARDGNVRAARWCAGCHDPAPFFSGAFDDPNFDDVNHPTAQAGITCTSCHSISHINSSRGNADYTIEEPIHYPFAYSKNRFLQYVNHQLVKAKPEFHKATFLKPLHTTAEFCAACHKVSIPGELNHYKEFLRGQNHYDTYLLSGISGHSARSFYYPEKATENCAACHMPPAPSGDFGAKFIDAANPRTLAVHDHLFPSANTGVAFLRGDEAAIKAHQAFLRDVARVDIFGVREGGAVNGRLTAPLRPAVSALVPGEPYLFEVVLRTLKVGHPLTQGTADSNELWLDVTVMDGEGRVIGRSGGLGPDKAVDPWSHFVNVYMLDKNGRRIDRRNPQDIFTPLYDHQVPPGAARVVHYALVAPAGLNGSVSVDVKLQYRKFDATYMHYVFGADFIDALPITTIASDRVQLPVGTGVSLESALLPAARAGREIPEWQRWNDYGIGLLLEGDQEPVRAELASAEAAFKKVESLGRADGPLNLARVYIKESRLQDAVAALQRASHFNPPAPRWTIAWLSGVVDKQNGRLDEAISELRSVVEDRYPELERRRFDFSKDYEVLNELGQTLFERAKMEVGPEAKPAHDAFLRAAADQFRKTLAIDSENVAAHYNLWLIDTELGDAAGAADERRLHDRYRADDNARDHAVAAARLADPAAECASRNILVYPLQRPGAWTGSASAAGPPQGLLSRVNDPERR